MENKREIANVSSWARWWPGATECAIDSNKTMDL